VVLEAPAGPDDSPSRPVADMDELNPAEKPCRECGVTKPLEAFGLKLGKRLPRCKDCMNRAERERRAADPERFRERERRRYATGGREAKLAQSRGWYARNQQHNIDRKRVYYGANRDQLAGWTARWRARNPDRAAELGRMDSALRRARKKGNGSAEPLTHGEIGERDGWICGLCHLPVDPALKWPHPQSRVLDHVIPLARGGTHTSDNVQIAHWLCNARKGARLDDELALFNADGTLTCRLCDEDKDPSEFHLAAASRNGHRSECKECWSASRRKVS